MIDFSVVSLVEVLVIGLLLFENVIFVGEKMCGLVIVNILFEFSDGSIFVLIIGEMVNIYG